QRQGNLLGCGELSELVHLLCRIKQLKLDLDPTHFSDTLDHIKSHSCTLVVALAALARQHESLEIVLELLDRLLFFPCVLLRRLLPLAPDISAIRRDEDEVPAVSGTLLDAGFHLRPSPRILRIGLGVFQDVHRGLVSDEVPDRGAAWSLVAMPARTLDPSR